MHDMDQSAVKAGGEASFFTGTLKKYSWDKVLDSRLGNHEKLHININTCFILFEL